MLNPFTGCIRLKELFISGFSNFKLNTVIENLDDLSSAIITADNPYFIEDCCFEGVPKLSSFTFGKAQSFECFSEFALSNSNLLSIQLDGIDYEHLPDGQITYDKYESRPISATFNFDVNPDNLKYGIIYTDLSACVEFCARKSLPLIVFSGPTNVKNPFYYDQLFFNNRKS